MKSETRLQNGKFLGADSARDVTLHFPKVCYKQTVTDHSFQWYFNGFIVGIGESLGVVDPGVDFYTRFTQAGLDLNDVIAIFISHEHIDHTASLLVLVDMIVRLGKPIDLIMPEDCLKSRLPDYLRDEILRGKTNINLILLTNENFSDKVQYNSPLLDGLSFVKLYHSALETFGFSLKIGKQSFVYVSDTGYAEEIETSAGLFPPSGVKGDVRKITVKHGDIKEAVSGATHAVVNINDIAYSRHARTHLTAWDVQDIFAGTNLVCLYLQHQFPYNIHDEDNSIDFCDFFADQPYEVHMPYGEEFKITL